MPCFSLTTPEHVHRGSIKICYQDGEITSIDMLVSPGRKAQPQNDFEAMLMAQFEAYFADPGFRFDLALRPQGTDFQRRVWQTLLSIPAGRVSSYGELAKQLGSSARAVGNACRRNPVPIVVPCHRVVAKSGIGGFGGALSGQLIDQKRRLLQHEGVAI